MAMLSGVRREYNGFAFGSEAEWVASESLATFYIV